MKFLQEKVQKKVAENKQWIEKSSEPVVAAAVGTSNLLDKLKQQIGTPV